MTPGGWLMMLGSWAVIIGLNVYCILKLFREKPAEPVTGRIPIERP